MVSSNKQLYKAITQGVLYANKFFGKSKDIIINQEQTPTRISFVFVTDFYEHVTEICWAHFATQRLFLMYEILRGKLARGRPNLIPFANAPPLTAVFCVGA